MKDWLIILKVEVNAYFVFFHLGIFCWSMYEQMLYWYDSLISVNLHLIDATETVDNVDDFKVEGPVTDLSFNPPPIKMP